MPLLAVLNAAMDKTWRITVFSLVAGTKAISAQIIVYHFVPNLRIRQPVVAFVLDQRAICRKSMIKLLTAFAVFAQRAFDTGTLLILLSRWFSASRRGGVNLGLNL